MLAPTTATGLPHRAESGPWGREAQSTSVLDLARDGGVVLRGGEQDGVGTLELGPQTLHLGGRSVLAVLVERRQELEILVDVDGHVVGRDLCGGPQQRRVVRRCAQAAGDTEDPHRTRRS